MLSMLAPQSATHKHQAHGLTVGQMAILKDKQASGEVDKITANNDPSYEINEHEKHLMHITLEDVRFNEKTGDRLSKPNLKKFYVNDFEKMSKSTVVKKEGKPFDYAENAFGKYEVKIIHDPRKKEGSSKTNSSKSVSEMSDDELKLKYKDVFGEDAPSDYNNTQIIAMIESELK